MMRRISKFLNYHRAIIEAVLTLIGAIMLVWCFLLLGATDEPNFSEMVAKFLTGLKIAIIFEAFLGSLLVLRWHLKKKIDNLDYLKRVAEQERINYINKKEREQQALLRQHIDLILLKINNFYRVKLLYGTGETEYLYYNKQTYDFPHLEKKIENFRFYPRDIGSCKDFPEEALPTLKKIIERYQKYGADSQGYLNPEPEKITILEKFAISRPIEEDPPDLTGLDTIHELAPLLIEAENNGDQRAVNKVLDKMEKVNSKILTIN